jgi:hypothetical protein
MRQVSIAADRLEDFVRSNRSRSRDVADADPAISMGEGLLSSAIDDADTVFVPLVPNRQKKSASSPEIFLPSSLSQLEDAVSFPPCGRMRHF